MSSPGPILRDFAPTRPRYVKSQERMLAWLAESHAQSQATTDGLDPAAKALLKARLEKVIGRCACPPDKIAQRGSCVADLGCPSWGQAALYDFKDDPHGGGTALRARYYDAIVGDYFDTLYADGDRAPRDLIHVTCTGYVSPSGAQRTVAHRGWGALTRVTHAYHMGCYAAMPAVRIAAGFTAAAGAVPARAARRVDVVHTELCTLHLDPSDHSLEQLVVQSLFADGLIRYAMVPPDGEGPGLRLRALREEIVPGSEDAMTWVFADHGAAMTLSREVPRMIGGALPPFVRALFEAGGRPGAEADAVFAVHPGGPKIIDAAAELLGLGAAQVQASRDVLHDHGNMSSATLPHVWGRIVADAAVAPGTLVCSLAFGPGLTIAGGLFEKV